MEILTDDQIAALTEPKYTAPQQYGPMRQYDTTMRCASRGCGSPTWVKLQGVPYCNTHCMNRMNEMLYQLGVES